MRIFLDANVLFSAAAADRGLGRSIRFVSNEHRLVTSEATLAEATTNIESKRPDWANGLLELEALLDVVVDVDASLPVELVEKDRHVLAGAITGGCDLLVTGDKRHFGHLYDQTIVGVTVVSIQGLFDRLNDQ